jgi:hypothetical protein
VVAEVDGKKKNMGDRRYRLRRVPDPVAKVGGKSGGRISKNELAIQTGVIAELEDFLFDMKFNVRGFKVTIISGGAGGFVKDATAIGPAFTANKSS